MSRNNAVTTIQNHRINVHNMPPSKTVNLGNTPIIIICRQGMVTLLHSSHFQALRSSISSLHSTCDTVGNLPAAQANNIQVMGHRGTDITCTKAVMAGLKCSPLRSFQDKGRHFQVHQECLQDRREIIHSISQHLPARLLHLNLIPAQLWNTP